MLDVPRADDDDVLISPRDNAMCIAGVLHIGQGYQFPICLVYFINRLQVCLGISDTTTSYINLSAYLDALAVPDVRHALVAEHAFFFGPSLHVEQYDVVVIKEVQAYLP